MVHASPVPPTDNAAAYTWQEVIRANSTDTYSRTWLRFLLPVALSAYLALVLLTPSQTTAAAAATTGEAVRYTSPEGLRMTLDGPFSAALLKIHYVAGVALIPLALVQKHLLTRMVTPGTPSGDARALWIRDAVHPALGGTIVTCMLAMAVAGYMLRTPSTFPGFSTAMVFFVAPWAVFIAGIGFSASWGFKVVHAVIGNCIVKACVAVPLARLSGTALQRLYTDAAASAASAGDAPTPAVLSAGYYHGILFSAVVIGAWQLFDLWEFRQHLRGARKNGDIAALLAAKKKH